MVCAVWKNVTLGFSAKAAIVGKNLASMNLRGENILVCEIWINRFIRIVFKITLIYEID